MELQPIYKQGVYTVSYGTSTKSAKQGRKATTYILDLCVHYFSLKLQLFIAKWHDVKY